jgi:cytochrome c5
MKKIALFCAAAVIAAAGFVHAADTVKSIELPAVQTQLKAGEGKMKVDTNCAVCHSTDYITLQPSFSKAQWTGTVTKMIKVFGAQINEDDAKVISNYLATQYGTGK